MSPRLRPPSRERVLQRRAGQCGVTPGAQAPAQEPARVLVHDDRHVAPLLANTQVGDVGHPHLIGGLELEMALPVGDAVVEGFLSHPAASIQASAAALDARAAHEPGDAPPADRHAGLPHGLGHPRAAVRAQARHVNAADLRGDALVVELALARLARPPGIEASARNAQEPAHHRGGPRLPVCLDDGEDVALRSETNRIAFFSRSCSIWS